MSTNENQNENSQRLDTTNVNLRQLNPTGFRNIICDDSSRERLIVFRDANEADVVIRQLCNLTTPEFVELFNDFRSELNPVALLEQVRKESVLMSTNP